MDPFDELVRWEALQAAALERGFMLNVDRHKLTLSPMMIKVIDHEKRGTMNFASMEAVGAWLNGYDWMLAHASSMGFDLKAAERAAYEQWDQQRILRVLSTE
jgi:hypothetical protein